MGAYGLAERTIAQLHRRSPEALREQLWSDEWLQSGLAALKTRLDEAERDALRLYFQAIELVSGEQSRAVLILCGSLGVNDPEQLKRLVELAKSADDAKPADALQLAEELVGREIRSNPDYRRRSMQRLYGLIDASAPEMARLANGDASAPVGTTEAPRGARRSGSARVAKNGNGHADGNGG